MTREAKTYDLGRTARILAPWLYVVAVLDLSSAAIAFVQRSHLGTLDPTLDYEDIFAGLSPAFNDFTLFFGFAYLFFFFGCLICGGFWIYRAASNAKMFGDDRHNIKPGWSVGWYFVPIANLWMPYNAMKSIYSASTYTGVEDYQNNLPQYFIWWWLTWIAGNLVAQRSFRIWNNANSLDSFQVSLGMDVFVGIVGVVSALLFRKLVLEVTEAQKNSGVQFAKVFE